MLEDGERIVIFRFYCHFAGICSCIWGRLTPDLVALHQMALCYFQIYIVDRYTFRPYVYLVLDFTKIVLSPAVDFEGDVVLELSVHPSSFCPSIGLWNTESWPIVKSDLLPTTDLVGKLSVTCKYLRKALVMYDTSVDP